MADYILLMPEVTGVVLTPNPGVMNKAVAVSVTVVEKQVILYPEARYSGEFYAGEV